VSFQPSAPGQNVYQITAISTASWQFQFTVEIPANDSATEAQLDSAFQALVTAIDGSSAWSVSYAKKSNVDDQQVTP
jgi:hypothetical protein